MLLEFIAIGYFRVIVYYCTALLIDWAGNPNDRRTSWSGSVEWLISVVHTFKVFMYVPIHTYTSLKKMLYVLHT